MSNLFSEIFWRKFFPSKNETISISIFHCSIFTNITFYYFIVGCLIDFFFKGGPYSFNYYYSALCFPNLFFCRTKLSKFQIYYTNFFFSWGNYHDNQNSPQNYNIILTEIKIKLKALKIDNLLIYYSHNL